MTNQLIHWAGEELNSVEECFMTIHDAHILVASTFTGKRDGIPVQLRYDLFLTPQYDIISADIISIVKDQRTSYRLIQSQPRRWKVNDETRTDLDGGVTIDISLTPFTNTLVIQYLKSLQAKEVNPKVIYFDIEASEICPEQQSYKLIDQHQYLFESHKHDFKARITVDDEGLVLDYPALFKTLPKAKNKNGFL